MIPEPGKEILYLTQADVAAADLSRQAFLHSTSFGFDKYAGPSVQKKDSWGA